MKQLPLTGKHWALVLIAALIVMYGAVSVLKKARNGPDDIPTNTLGADAGGRDLSTNTLGDDVPPMPNDSGFPSGGGTAITTGSGSGSTGGQLEFDVPVEPPPAQPVAEQPRMPVVWVTETDAKAYSQPGFNMPVVRELEQWEELLIVETSKENWDRVQDLQGQQFWVQKKIVTIIRPQNLSQPSVAEKKVMDFYTQVAHKEHSDAYVHLSPEWKRELSFDAFVKGYSRTDSLRSEIVNVLSLGEDRYQVDVAQEAIEEGESVDYLGIYTVEKVDGKWYLTSGSLNRQAKRF